MLVQKYPKLKIAQLYFLFVLFLILPFVKSNSDDDLCFMREMPIYNSDLGYCSSMYCTPDEYSENTCIIGISIIKTQWLNNFHIFWEKDMEHISVSTNKNGDLFLSSHKTSGDYDKYLIGFNSEGYGLFYNEEKKIYTSFEVIDFKKFEFADYNNYIEIDGKGYLIGIPTNNDIYLIDYVNKTAIDYIIEPESVSSDTIFKVNGYDDLFFTSYIFCKKYGKDDCYINFQYFKFNSTNLTYVNNFTDTKTIFDSRINCFQNDLGIIFCFYKKVEGKSNFRYVLGLINPISFKLSDSIVIENSFYSSPAFDEVINLRDNLYILAYTYNEEKKL